MNIESTKTAPAKTNAAQRAILAGVAITASAPTTGKNNIHVRSLVNIITSSSSPYRVGAGHRDLVPALVPYSSMGYGRGLFPPWFLLDKQDQREDHDCQYRDAAKEARHVGLHLACLYTPRLAPRTRHQPGHAIDDPIDNVGIESRFDVRDAKDYVANEQVVQIIDVEFAQCEPVQEAQDSIVLHKVMDGCQIVARVECVGPAQADKGYDYTNPGQWIGQYLSNAEIGRARLDIAEKARPVA